MISFTLTDEQKELQQTARDFAQKEIKPLALKLDSAGHEIDAWQAVQPR